MFYFSKKQDIKVIFFNIKNTERKKKMTKKTEIVKETGKGKLSKFPKSLLSIKDDIILHRLVNSKKGKSAERLEQYKFSTTIADSVSNGMSKDDYDYNTDKLSTVYSVSLRTLKKDKKSMYLDLIAANELFIKENKTFNNKDAIIKNMETLKKEINNL